MQNIPDHFHPDNDFSLEIQKALSQDSGLFGLWIFESQASGS